LQFAKLFIDYLNKPLEGKLKNLCPLSFILMTVLSISVKAQEDFTLILLPDTQYESRWYSVAFNSQTQWIVDNKSTQNIVFVTHVGDIVDRANNNSEYTNADAAMDKLDAGNVDYSVGPGNHDMGDGSLYETYFGVARFAGKSLYAGNYGGNNYNNYSLFSASGMDFILINLQYHPTEEMLDWADGLLKANLNRRGIVESHEILKIDDTWFSEYIYLALRDNPNLFLMVCGHDWTLDDGAAYLAELGDDGHTIHIMLADYQGFDLLGNGGYLRILRFSPANDKIYATTYSPYIDKYITSYPDHMEMTYDMTFPFPVELTSFNAKAEGQNVILIWQTVTEVKNYGFEVERASSMTSPSQVWEKIGFVSGNGNSNSPKDYSFTDKNPSGGSKFIYRLKQIDNNGKFEYSNEVEIELVPNEFNLFQNYPNPFNPATNIKFALPKAAKVTLLVYNLLGEKVAALLNEDKEAGFYDVQFNASNFSTGVYIFRLTAGDFVQTKKMTLMK